MARRITCCTNMFRVRLRSLPSAEEDGGKTQSVRCGVDTAQGERQHAKADQRGRGSPLSCRGSIPTNAKSLSTASAAHRRAAVASSVLMASRCDEQLQNVVSKRSDPLVLAAIGEGGVQIGIVQSPPPLPAPRTPPRSPTPLRRNGIPPASVPDAQHPDAALDMGGVSGITVATGSRWP
jgi:hypothetical protein